MAAFNLASKMAAKLSFQVFIEFTGWSQILPPDTRVLPPDTRVYIARYSRETISGANMQYLYICLLRILLKTGLNCSGWQFSFAKVPFSLLSEELGWKKNEKNSEIHTNTDD